MGFSMFCPCEKGGESQKKGKWGEEEWKEGNASSCNVFKACLQRTLTFLTKQEFFVSFNKDKIFADQAPSLWHVQQMLQQMLQQTPIYWSRLCGS